MQLTHVVIDDILLSQMAAMATHNKRVWIVYVCSTRMTQSYTQTVYDLWNIVNNCELRHWQPMGHVYFISTNDLPVAIHVVY